MQNTRDNFTSVSFESNHKIVVFAEFNNCFLNSSIVTGFLRFAALSKAFAEVQDGLVGIAVENDAFDFLTNFVYLISILLLFIHDEASEF
jgi:hypothetical protein